MDGVTTHTIAFKGYSGATFVLVMVALNFYVLAFGTGAWIGQEVAGHVIILQCVIYVIILQCHSCHHPAVCHSCHHPAVCHSCHHPVLLAKSV